MEKQTKTKETKMKNKIEEIAKEVLGIDTLEEQKSDELDFHEVSVWCLKEALEKAYAAGAQSTRNQ